MVDDDSNSISQEEIFDIDTRLNIAGQTMIDGDLDDISLDGTLSYFDTNTGLNIPYSRSVNGNHTHRSFEQEASESTITLDVTNSSSTLNHDSNNPTDPYEIHDFLAHLALRDTPSALAVESVETLLDELDDVEPYKISLTIMPPNEPHIHEPQLATGAGRLDEGQNILRRRQGSNTLTLIPDPQEIYQLMADWGYVGIGDTPGAPGIGTLGTPVASASNEVPYMLNRFLATTSDEPFAYEARQAMRARRIFQEWQGHRIRSSGFSDALVTTSYTEHETTAATDFQQGDT